MTTDGRVRRRLETYAVEDSQAAVCLTLYAEEEMNGDKLIIYDVEHGILMEKY